MNRLQLLSVISAALVVGLGAGIGGYTFVYAKGASYLTSDPQACANCHIMDNHYEAWLRGPHHTVAVCNDCHAPHNLLGKYAIKGINGFNHSLAFTTGRFHEPIQIKALNKSVTEGACRHCHADIVNMIDAHEGIEPLSCIRCHSEVGHIE